MSRFRLAAGSVIGRDHRHVGRNNQDALAIHQSEPLTIAIVADGCSSGKYSEVGAHLGVRLLAENLREQHALRGTINWDTAMRQVLARLDILASSMGGSYRTTVEDYFLFTLVGVVIDAQSAQFFQLGDGTVYLNGTHVRLGPFPNNAPPYLGYGLLEGRVDVDPELIRLQSWEPIPVTDLSHFLIGSDGVDDLRARADDRMPGMAECVGPVAQFWEDDRYFSGNPVLVSRRLSLIGRDWPRTNPELGLLGDDTTIVVGRREDA